MQPSTKLRRRRLVGTKVLAELLPRGPRRNLVITLVTVGKDGYPNACLLSPFQVVAKDDRVLFFAVYSGSKTQANLSRHHRATLVLFSPPAAYYVKGEAEQVVLPKRVSGLQGQALYRLKVTKAIRDYYAKAPITSTVEFEQSGVLPYYSRVYESMAGIVKTMQ